MLVCDGLVAQSVEQRTENPCVGSSILPRATIFSRFLPYFTLFFCDLKIILHHEYDRLNTFRLNINLIIY